MTWFAVSIVIGMKRLDGIGRISICENIVLVDAKTSVEARCVASEIGQKEANLDDGLTIDDCPATRVFAGIRKILNVSNPYPLDLDKDQPTTGTEVSYSEFEVPDEDALLRFARGETIDVLYLE